MGCYIYGLAIDMDILEFLYDYFENRTRATAFVRKHRPYALGLIGALLGGMSLFVAEALGGRLLLPFSLSSLVLIALWQLTVVLVSTAMLHLVLELTGARGNAGALFVHLGLSELAWIACVPAVLLTQAIFVTSAWPARLVFVIVGFWSLWLKARALSDEYGVGSGRAWLTLTAPILGFSLLIGVSVALTLVSFVQKAFSI
jgi:hypothetical protein